MGQRWEASSNSGLLGCCQNHSPISSFPPSSLQGWRWGAEESGPASTASSESPRKGRLFPSGSARVATAQLLLP